MEKTRLKTIIVEDELYDRKIIEKILQENYSLYIDILDLVDNTTDAIESIKENQPDLVFLDIELKGERDGAFTILNQVDHKFKIIFVTAKSKQDDFLRAIRLSCIDYLIKPTKISDFEAPILKAYKELINESEGDKNKIEIFRHNVNIKEKQESKISLQEGYSFIPVVIKNIIRCEAQGNYTRFFFSNHKSLLINGNLKSFCDRLCDFGFCRISKSDLINLSQIESFSRKNISWEVHMSDTKTILISNQRKHGFMLQYNALHV